MVFIVVFNVNESSGTVQKRNRFFCSSSSFLFVVSLMVIHIVKIIKNLKQNCLLLFCFVLYFIVFR